MINTKVLSNIISSIKKGQLSDAIKDSYLLVGSEVNRLSKIGRRLLKEGKGEAAICYFDRCHGR